MATVRRDKRPHSSGITRMRSFRTLWAVAVVPSMLVACRDTLAPATGRLLPVVPGAIAPRASSLEPVRIPVAILVECGDHRALALDIRIQDGEVRYTARGRAPDFSGGCLADIETVLRDTLVLAPIHLRDSTIVRFRQPSGADSVRVVYRNAPIAAP